MKNSEQPISPCIMQQVGANDFRLSKSNDPKEHNIPCSGLTKREYFAAMAMQGLLSIYDNSEHPAVSPNEQNVIYMAELAVKAADALLTSLEKTEQ